ncbi:MAG: agmatinase [Gemmatimonadaceae bacterium]|nr:agmatinase [Gemmatimonadaceae bacterium]
MTLPPPCLVGVPYDASSSFLRGPAEAPALIRAALHSPAGNDWTEAGINLFAPGGLADAGDLDLPNEPGEHTRERITEGIARVLRGGARPISLGGDHSITYPILRAVHRVHPRPALLHIDAHSDLYDHYEGDRHSHACPFARVMEEGLCSRLVQVGLRTLSAHQREQSQRFGTQVIEMRHFAAGARPRIEGPVYVSFDMDALDPAFAPGVSHWEPGGLSVRDVISMIHALEGPIIGADVVEFNPARDRTGLTAAVAAKIVRELAGTMLRPAGST